MKSFPKFFRYAFLVLLIAIIALQIKIIFREPPPSKEKNPNAHYDDGLGFRPISNNSVEQWMIGMFITGDLKRALYYSRYIEGDQNQLQGYAYEKFRRHLPKELLEKGDMRVYTKMAIACYEKATVDTNADIGRCYFWMGDRKKARYHFALAVISIYVEQRKYYPEDIEIARRWSFIRICRHVIRAPYRLATPFFDSRTFVLFIKEGLQDCNAEEKEVFERAILILDDLFGENGPVVYNEPSKYGE